MTPRWAPPQPRALLFDWDNTLVDSWSVIHQALAVTFEAMGVEPWTLDATKERVRASLRDSFPKMFGSRAEEAKALYLQTFEAMHLERLEPCPGADAMLRALASNPELTLGVISNKTGRLLRKEARHLGWEEHFHSLVGAGDAARDKPESEAVHLALQGSGVVPGPAVWLVGDTDIDMLCALRCGCTPVLLRPEPPRSDEFADCQPLLYVSDCVKFAEMINGWLIDHSQNRLGS